ncbi:hypothetical protein IV102_36340 [bacterium]|nr:hypothetical protein [bacterium]
MARWFHSPTRQSEPAVFRVSGLGLTAITGTGPLRANNAVLQSQGAIKVSTDVSGLAAISSTNSVTILESNGLSPSAWAT